MANQNESQFGERMSIEQFMELPKVKSKNFDVYPRMKDGQPVYGKDDDGNPDTSKPLFYFASGPVLGYVPSELGQKLQNKEKTGDLFITEVTTPGYAEPMFMLCESKRESVFHFSLD